MPSSLSPLGSTVASPAAASPPLIMLSSLSPLGSGDRVDTLKNPEKQPLFLPSSIPYPLNQGNDIKVFVEKETCLCIAQADEVLSDIRRGRRTITGLNQFNISGAGNKPNTPMRMLYNCVMNKISRAANR